MTFRSRGKIGIWRTFTQLVIHLWRFIHRSSGASDNRFGILPRLPRHEAPTRRRFQLSHEITSAASARRLDRADRTDRVERMTWTGLDVVDGH